MPRKSYVSWGEGIAYDSVNGLFFPSVEMVQFNFGLETIEIEDADSMVNAFEAVKMPLTGHISFGKLNSDIWVMLTGGEASAGGMTRVRHEAHTSEGDGAESAAFDLDATPSEYSDLIRQVDGGILKRVAATPTGGEYTLIGTHVLLSGSAGGTFDYDCDYLVDTDADQVTVLVEDNDSPTNFGLVATFRGVDKDAASETKGDIIIIAPKCRRTGQITFGGGPKAQNKVEFDFVIEKSPGNPLYKMIFPSA